MKTLIATLLASAFITGPALACGFNKSASYSVPQHTASVEQKVEDAISTFDPEAKSVFEETTKVSNEKADAEEEITE